MRGTNQKHDAQESKQRACYGEAEAAPNKSTKVRRTEAKEINWQHWWPFDRATGTALRQLNRKPSINQFEESPL